MMNKKLIFIFLDGIGLAKKGPNNLFQHSKMPFINRLLNGPLVKENCQFQSHLLLKGIDANLGISGIPQSATGQTALFTGINAAELLGFHQPAFPGKELKEVIDQDNIFLELIKHNKQVTFANCYSPQYFQLINEGKRVHSVTTLLLISADLPFRKIEELNRNEALCWDITRDYLVHYQDLPVKTVSPQQAGQHLAKLAGNYHFTLFESFLTDLLGHKRSIDNKKKLLYLIDNFLEKVYHYKDQETSIIITSDHGNIEEGDSGQHNRNPVPLLVLGDAAKYFSQVQSILDVKRCCVNYLCF
ncbi:MAG: phosphoglyceromutase [Spirochaetes bacterium]|nr:phosphoglyceromutase [Spirochaetota bacterium]